jgi:hypothetical protein
MKENVRGAIGITHRIVGLLERGGRDIPKGRDDQASLCRKLKQRRVTLGAPDVFGEQSRVEEVGLV